MLFKMLCHVQDLPCVSGVFIFHNAMHNANTEILGNWKSNVAMLHVHSWVIDYAKLRFLCGCSSHFLCPMKSTCTDE
jgi:hypothetical protein